MGRPSSRLVDIDEQGVEVDSAFQEWLELPNGCVCCTAKDNLVMALENLVKLRNRFDYIFLETTGMANPLPLAKSLWVDEGLCSSVFLDSVVTFIDASSILFHLGHPLPSSASNVIEPRKTEASRQIAVADLLIVNKTDLIESIEGQHDLIKSSIKKINPLSPIVFTKRSVVSHEMILDRIAWNSSSGKNLESLEDALSTQNTCDPEEDSHHHHHQQQHQDDSVNAIKLNIKKPISSVDSATHFFGSLLWEHRVPVYRFKGELWIQGEENRYMVQGVADNFEITQTDWKWNEKLPEPSMDSSTGLKPSKSPNSFDKSMSKQNTLVFIGNNLNQHWMEELFLKDCFD